MSAVGEKQAIVRRAGPPAQASRALARTGARSHAPLLFGGDLLKRGLPQLLWTVRRTGRAGLAGLALLAGSIIFHASTQRPLEAEISHLQADLARAQARAAQVPQPASADAPRNLKGLPARTEIPKLLAVLLRQADGAQLAIDSAKYEIAATRTGALVRYQLSFPVRGSYSQIRSLIDSTLTAMPALAIDELSISRKTIADAGVEAQIRMTIFTRSPP